MLETFANSLYPPVTTTTTTMMRMTTITILKNACLMLTLLLCLCQTDQASVLRGNDGRNTKDLNNKIQPALHRQLLSDDYRGKTWTDLGIDIKVADRFRQKRRTEQSNQVPTFGNPTYSFFAVSFRLCTY
jgi:hypothetical protein